ncbi:hypothetical protein N657DRAFT_617551 [Parathielavia appendiculata]|uniref:Helicase C-terminal domain-containing protein n=1 Tax=Parathielavia appendiculata TaxID=2587402 RepID=A0AAN6U0W6_9PEZI|nr:hypothetical protein N657DRAFT_617551 [Parathielavia appendiculata]
MSSLPATTRNTKTTRFSLLSKISSTATTAAKTPTLRRESASLSSPAVNPTSASTYVNLIDMLKSEYYTSQIADADYGAVEETNPVLDTYLGSYNTGNTEAEWRACLEFFNVNVAEYMKREAIAGGDGQQRKRVPMKKLPGTTVGLFDYQLMGVCNLLRFVLADVSGGLLCDEQGLGKTQEMYGLIAFAAALRRCKAEVKAAWRKAAKWNDKKKGSPSQHNRPGAVAARSCPFDERYGFKCYCWHQPTRELADRLPDGPNVLVVPARSCASMVRDAKTKLDVKQFKIRGFHEGGDKEDKLTSADVSALRATITATQGEAGPVYQYQAAPDSEYLIVVSPEYIPRLNGLFGVELKVPNAAGKVKKSALVPGMILMDEFHEYAISKNGDESRVAAWLQHLKKCCLDSQQPTPLIYFVSGTPLGDTPANIRSAISLLEKDAWQNEAHPLNGATVESLDELTQTFDRLTGVQASGEMVPESEIVDYRRRLDRVLEHTMVRRLGTDQFQGRNLTDLGPLKVNIMDHQLPFSLIDSLQALADQTREQVVVAATSRGISVARLLRSKDGEALLLKLRLASIFPGIADPSSGAAFTFTTTEIHAHLAAAKGDVTKTPYFAHIPAWSASSPKLATLTQAIRTMLADKSPIPGSPTTSKKYCIFTPLESEAVLIQAYLLLSLKPVLLTSNMLQSARQRVLDQFLTEGNAPPNVLVAPMALAGTGLNLQRAKYSTVTGPAWTKRENQQAYYRIHRVGQRQATQLQLLTARWNPAERVVLAGYEGKEVKGKEGMWEVGNWFCEGEGDEGDWWGGISGEVSE